MPTPYEEFVNAEFKRSNGLSRLSKGSGISGPPEGFFLGTLDYLARPGYAVSETAQAIGAGEGAAGAWEGFKRGLSGERKFPTLGESAFPESKEEGFSLADVGAFGVDFIADPLIAIGAVGKGAKWVGPTVAKGLSKILPKVTPKVGAVLKEFPKEDFFMNPKIKAKLLADDLTALKMSPAEAMKRVLANFDEDLLPPHLASKFKMGRTHFAEKGAPKLALPDETTVQKFLETQPNEVLDTMRAGLRSIEANFRPGEMTLFQTGIAELAIRLAPAGAALRNFGGKSGKVLAKKYTDAMASTRLREGAVLDDLEQIVRGASTDDLKMAVAVREGKKFTTDPRIDKLSKDLGKLIDKHWDDLNDIQYDNAGKSFRGGADMDQFGDTLKVVNHETGEIKPLYDSYIKNYFPHRLDPKYIGNPKRLRDVLLAKNWDNLKVDKFIDKMQYRPDKVGHVELARLKEGLEELYEMDPRVVLPRYFRDTIMRQELGKQFGYKHQILDMLAGDLKKVGFRPTWVDNLAGHLTGTNKQYSQALQKLAGGLNSVQAITKLGFATSVANFGQGPLNQIIRNSYGNYFKSLWKGGIPVPNSAKILGGNDEGIRRLGLAAYNRGMQEQIRQMIGTMGGPLDGISTRYMKWIGFNYTERIGRMTAAVGGRLELDDMIGQWMKHTKAGKLGKANRVVSELNRKYDIDGNQLRKLFDKKGKSLKQYEDLLEEMKERGALKASDSIMHAFDVLDLPLGWRDPLWRSILQFKSFGYKQLEFMGKEVLQPALRYYATGGKEGTIGPLVRSAMMYPPMAIFVDGIRDVVRSAPSALIWGEWNLKDPYWEDPHPMARLWNDMMYVGTLGLMGDIIEQAQRGKLAPWVMGPTMGEVTRLGEEAVQGRLDPGKIATRFLPGAAGLHRGRSIMDQAQGSEDKPFEWLAKRYQ